MTNHDESLAEIKKEWHGTYRAYFIGFILSVILTVFSFSVVVFRVFPERFLTYTVLGLAIFQAIVQLLFFLHVGQEPKPRWETLVFLFMGLVLFIVVLGTLWIMFDLNHRVMPGMNKVVL